MRSCATCNRDVPPGSRFCVFCGTRLDGSGAGGGSIDPLIGQTFRGIYFIQRRIGGGGMGTVYQAMHVTLEVPIALKVIKKELLADRMIAERFHQEARAASRLRHHNITAVTDFGEADDGTLFMAMEYVSGKTLSQVIAEEQPLSEQRIVHVGVQILSALDDAHAAGILHRDLKPENVMLQSRRIEPDMVKVLDFGIAKLQRRGESMPTLTCAGMVCGTPAYMSPEQWRGEQLDARSDLYAVSVILHEMLTGKLPYDSGTPAVHGSKHLPNRSVAMFDDGAREVSADLRALIVRAFARDRDARPASAEAMIDELLACALAPDPAIRGAHSDDDETLLLDLHDSPRTPDAEEITRPPPAAVPEAHERPSWSQGLPMAADDATELERAAASEQRQSGRRSRKGRLPLLTTASTVLALAAATSIGFGRGSPPPVATSNPGPAATRTVGPARVAVDSSDGEHDTQLAPPPNPSPGAEPTTAGIREEKAPAPVPAESDVDTELVRSTSAGLGRSSDLGRRGTQRRVARARIDPPEHGSVARELCSRLLLRQAVGEPLTDRERQKLSEECHQ